MKAHWLFTKHPIVIDDELACVIGINEAIVIQKLNYWLHSKSAKFIDGRMWIYNTYANWRKDSFPFFSISTIRRTFTNLEKQGLVLTGNFNRAGFDKTKWYSIDEERLNELMSSASVQNEQTVCSNRADGVVQNEQPNTIDYTYKEEDINKKETEKLFLLDDLKRLAPCLPSERDWSTVKALSKRLTYEGLSFVVDNFKGVMYHKGNEVLKPYSYLIKMMREEIEVEKAIGD